MKIFKLSISQTIKALAIALLMTGCMQPAISFADDVDKEKADRVFKKFKERQEKREKEKRDNEKRSQQESAKSSQSTKSNNRNAQRNSEQKTRQSSGSSSSSRSSAREDKNSGEISLRRLLDINEPRESSSRSQQRRDSTQSRNNNSQVSERVSLDEAVNIVRRQSRGEVVGATTQGSGARKQHRIKVLIDGRRVRIYYVNAVTGEVH